MVPWPHRDTTAMDYDVQAPSQQHISPPLCRAGPESTKCAFEASSNGSGSGSSSQRHQHPLHTMTRFFTDGIVHCIHQWKKTTTRKRLESHLKLRVQVVAAAARQQRLQEDGSSSNVHAKDTTTKGASSTTIRTTTNMTRSQSLQSLGEIGATLFSPLDGPFEKSIVGNGENEHTDTSLDDSVEIPTRECNVGASRATQPDNTGTYLEEEEEEESDVEDSTVFLLEDGTELEHPYLLTMDVMKHLRQAMPTSTQLKLWTRLYSLARDGDVFTTFLNAVAAHRQTLLVILTTTGQVFGGFAEVHWGKLALQTDGSYHGTGRSFLYSIDDSSDANSSTAVSSSSSSCSTSASPTLLASSPLSVIQSAVDSTGNSQQQNVTIYPWQGVNEYSILCSTRNDGGMLAMGGGGKDASFGFCIQDFFSKGSSGPCATFGNTEPLSGVSHFDIVDFEVYGFVHNW